jgi:hypothetical protein
MPTVNNVPKKYTIKQRLPNENGNTVLQPLYPKTTASQIVVETDLNFATDDQIAQIDGLTSTYIPLTQKGQANGVATLDANAKIPSNQLPALAVTETHVVASEAEMLALTAQTGDVAVRTDIKENFILKQEPASTLANWIMLETPTDVVTSVNGQLGAVTVELEKTDTNSGDFVTGITVSGMEITVTKGNETHLDVETTGSGNAITSITVDDHTITYNKGTTFVEGNTNTGIVAGTYSVLTVGADGRATAGAQFIEVGAAEQTTPSASLAVGGLFFQEV